MIQYIIRRFLYAIPLLIGVNILTFVLFFVVNSPDDMARMQLGQKRVTEQAINNWKQPHGYNLPLLWNEKADSQEKITQTIFYQKSVGLFLFRFGVSDSGRNIGADIQERMWPSLALALPTLIVGLVVDISFALMLVLLFMGFYYNKAGWVADLAMIINNFFVIGILASFGAVLTLPGIAGIVITIAMSVDANILIFERMKEERRAGRGWHEAMACHGVYFRRRHDVRCRCARSTQDQWKSFFGTACSQSCSMASEGRSGNHPGCGRETVSSGRCRQAPRRCTAHRLQARRCKSLCGDVYGRRGIYRFQRSRFPRSESDCG